MRRIHIALSVEDLEASVTDYTQRLNCEPCLIVPHEYALWRTEEVNFSIRRSEEGKGMLRHLGWEDSSAIEFARSRDVNGVVWEHFTASQQQEEIQSIWPSTPEIDEP